MTSKKSMINSSYILTGLGLMIFLSSAIYYSGGSYGGYSGSPGDDNKTCSYCHGSNAVTKDNWITTDIPSSGYVPGQSYTITINATHSGVQKIGFESSVEDAAKNKQGTLILTNSTETKLVANNSAITHTFNGTTPSGDNKSWSYEWTAPAQGTGSVTFYAAILAVNNSGTGDPKAVYKTSYPIVESGGSSLADHIIMGEDVHVYPIPAKKEITVLLGNNNAVAGSINLYDLNGKILQSRQMSDNQSILVYKFNIENLESGTYFILVNTENGIVSKKVVAIK